MLRKTSPRFLRRDILGTGVGIGFGASFATGLSSVIGQDADPGGKPLQLSITGYPYERVRAIQEGRVSVSGCEVTFEPSSIGEMNRHIFSGPQTRDVSEVGLIPYLLAFCNGGFRDYRVLPVFVLKVFRHKSMFVRTDAGIKRPQDLRGRRVATPGYSSSGLTWIRGILKDEYGVSPDEIDWVITSKDSAKAQTGGVSKWEKQLPEGLKYTRAPEGKDDSDLLIAGEVDAIFHPAEPKAYVQRDPRIDRLFPDHRTIERDYYRRTGIYPIMHLVAIRSDLADREPWLSKAVCDAYSEAKQFDLKEMQRIRWAYSALPWYGQEFEETRKLMGDNFYSYGIDQNRKAMETVFRYLHDQGLAERLLTIDEVFGDSTAWSEAG